MARKPKAGIDPSARNTPTGKMLTPEQIASSGSEHAHQAAIMQWTVFNRKHFPGLDLLFAVPNGGDRQISVAASLKAEGVKSGVPDLCLPVPLHGYAGLWIELKVPERVGVKDGGRSPKQVEWHERLVDQGYAVATAYGWQAACWVIACYYWGRLDMSGEGGQGVEWLGGVKATPMGSPPVVEGPAEG